MESAIIFLIVCIVATGFTSVTAYFFLRPNGIVEKMSVLRDKELLSLRSSYSELFEKTEKMEVRMNSLNLMNEELTAMVSRRITSFETRYGKQAKADEKELLREDAFRAITHLNSKG